MKAIIIGATGATGKDLVEQLISSPYFSEIIIFIRRKSPFQHSKITEHIIDFNDTKQWKSWVKGDVLFSCLGTTLADAGSKEAQYQVDYTYQFEFAKAAKENGVPQYILVSAGYANPDSWFFYTKMKGKLEESVKALHFERTVILQPPALERKNSERTAEIITTKTFSFLAKLPFLSGIKPMKTNQLAEAMVTLSLQKERGVFTLPTKEIWKIIK